jgi:hypothetical protein
MISSGMLGAPALYQLVSLKCEQHFLFVMLYLMRVTLVKLHTDRLGCLQCLLHIMHIWRPSELDFTWSQIPLTVVLWQVVPVALSRVDAVPEHLGMLLSGLCLLSKKT